MSRPFGIAGIQMAVVPWDAEATAIKMDGAVRYLARSFPWLDLVLGHELALSGLVQFSDRPGPATLRQLATTIPGPVTDRLCETAAAVGKWLVPGSMYETDGDQIFNTAVVISPQGEIVARYRKMFPWLPYETGVSAGDEFCVFDIAGAGRFGLAICYDMWFPEVPRTLAWMGADVILSPSMTPTSDREIELTLARANAIFNQCFVVGVNGVGTWGGGRSLIVDPNGRVLQQAGERQMLMTEVIDLAHVRLTREYGTLGLNQVWKQFRGRAAGFPVYGNAADDGPVFASLGPVAFQDSLHRTTSDS
ncbi:MAG TPA: carbon-nitrogen hydrolase family protein [Streptosporangiaceae bacterium]|nr:carbon-nitrogen hydrolase family protein [Streptosporangiaceae bacterium]